MWHIFVTVDVIISDKHVLIITRNITISILYDFMSVQIAAVRVYLTFKLAKFHGGVFVKSPFISHNDVALTMVRVSL